MTFSERVFFSFFSDGGGGAVPVLLTFFLGGTVSVLLTFFLGGKWGGVGWGWGQGWGGGY